MEEESIILKTRSIAWSEKVDENTLVARMAEAKSEKVMFLSK